MSDLPDNSIARPYYQILYCADEQPECPIYRVIDQRTGAAVLVAVLAHEDEAALHTTRTLLHALEGVQSAALLPLREHIIADLTCYVVVDDPGGQDLARTIQEQGLAPRTHQPPLEISALRQTERLLDVLFQLHSQSPPLLVGDLHAVDLWSAPNSDLSLAPFALLRPIGAGVSPYRAPEVEDPAGTPSPAGDLYALGAVCYHLLTGWRPPAATLRQTGTPLQAPHTFHVHISPLFERIILRAMEIDAADRYQTADELRRALELVRMAEASRPVPLPPLATSDDQPVPLVPPPAVSSASVVTTPRRNAPHTPAAPEPAPAPPAAVPRQSYTCLFLTLTLLLVLLVLLCTVGVFVVFGPGRVLLESFLWLGDAVACFHAAAMC